MLHVLHTVVRANTDKITVEIYRCHVMAEDGEVDWFTVN